MSNRSKIDSETGGGPDTSTHDLDPIHPSNSSMHSNQDARRTHLSGDCPSLPPRPPWLSSGAPSSLLLPPPPPLRQACSQAGARGTGRESTTPPALPAADSKQCRCRCCRHRPPRTSPPTPPFPCTARTASNRETDWASGRRGNGERRQGAKGVGSRSDVGASLPRLCGDGWVRTV